MVRYTGRLCDYMAQLAHAESEGEKRITAMVKEFEAMGYTVERHGDEITVTPPKEEKHATGK